MPKRLSQEEAELKIKDGFVENVILISQYTTRRGKVKLKCLDCGYEWETEFKNAGYGSYKHHCLNCWDRKEQDKWEDKVCAYCGKTVKRLKSKIAVNKTGLFYCSRECGNRHKNVQREENGEWVASKNYRLRAFQNQEHKCAICNWNEDERILEVHHVDENRENNLTENLKILCPTCHRKITLGYYKLVENQLIDIS